MSSWTYSNQGAFVYRNICWNLGCRKTKLECGCSNTNVPPRAMIKKIAKAVLASMGTLPRQGLQWLRESLGVEFRFEMVSLMQGSTFWWAALLVVFCFRSVHITLHVYIMRCLAWLKNITPKFETSPYGISDSAIMGSFNKQGPASKQIWNNHRWCIFITKWKEIIPLCRSTWNWYKCGAYQGNGYHKVRPTSQNRHQQ